MPRRSRPRSDGSHAPRARRTPKPDPTPAQLDELERLTDRLPGPLRAFRDRGLIGAKRRFHLEEALRHRTRSLVVVLHGVHDPHNQAAVMRSCEAFGVQELRIVPEAGESFRPSGRVTQNAHRWLDVVFEPGFEGAAAGLRGRGLCLLAAAVTPDSIPLAEIDFTRPAALVFGNESRGLPAAVTAACDGSFAIPMYGLSQSLNISVAAGVVLDRAIEQRRRAWGEPGDLDAAGRMALRRRFYLRAAGNQVPDDLRELLDERAGVET